MPIVVQKYGGSSLADAASIKRVARRITETKRAGSDVCVVVSAMGDATDELMDLALQVSPRPKSRELDMLLTTGERQSAALLAMALSDLGVEAVSYTGSQAGVITTPTHGNARIIDITPGRIESALDEGDVVIVAGFQGVDEAGNITTLGRGGSDTTGVALAAAIKADECQIYTDVDGVYTTDPRVVPEARKLDTITFEEMLEMASLGSKVLQLRSVEFAGKYKVKLRVLSSFQEEGEGTLITVEEEKNMEQPIISGIAFTRDEAKITVLGVPDKPGIAYQILGPVADGNVDVDMIIQNVGHDGTTDFSFTVSRADYDKAMNILSGVQAHIGAREIRGDRTMAKVSVVGVGMRSHPGVASRMFRTLAEEGINLQMISTSEIKISVVIDEKYLELAVRVLHRAFGLDQATV